RACAWSAAAGRSRACCRRTSTPAFRRAPSNSRSTRSVAFHRPGGGESCAALVTPSPLEGEGEGKEISTRRHEDTKTRRDNHKIFVPSCFKIPPPPDRACGSIFPLPQGGRGKREEWSLESPLRIAPVPGTRSCRDAHARGPTRRSAAIAEIPCR